MTIVDMDNGKEQILPLAQEDFYTQPSGLPLEIPRLECNRLVEMDDAENEQMLIADVDRQLNNEMKGTSDNGLAGLVDVTTHSPTLSTSTSLSSPEEKENYSSTSTANSVEITEPILELIVT